MEKKSYYVGVDIGTSNITMVVGEMQENNLLNILDSSIQESKLGIIDGRINNVDVVGSAILAAKKELEESLNLNITEAYVGIANEFVRCATISDFVEVRDKQNRCITEEDLRLLNKRIADIKCDPASKEQILERIPLCYIIDGKRECQNPVGEIGTWLSAKYLVILSNTEQMRRLSLAFHKAHLSIKKSFANTVSQPHLLLSKDEWNEGAAIVDIGSGTTDVSVVYNNKLRHIASLPIGSIAIDDDIASIGIPKRLINNIKRRYAVAMCENVGENDVFPIRKISKQKEESFSLYNLAAIIEARLCDIAEFVLDELRYSRLIQQIKGGVILTGGVANIKDIDKLFQRELKVPVRIAADFHGLTKGSASVIASTSETAAIAAALYGNSPCIVEDKSAPITAPRVIQPKVTPQPVAPKKVETPAVHTTVPTPAEVVREEQTTPNTPINSEATETKNSLASTAENKSIEEKPIVQSKQKKRKWSLIFDKIIGYDKNNDELL